MFTKQATSGGIQEPLTPPPLSRALEPKVSPVQTGKKLANHEALRGTSTSSKESPLQTGKKFTTLGAMRDTSAVKLVHYAFEKVLVPIIILALAFTFGGFIVCAVGIMIYGLVKVGYCGVFHLMRIVQGYTEKFCVGCQAAGI